MRMPWLNVVMQTTLYEVPLNLREEGLDEIVVNHLKLTTPAPDMSEWEELVDRIQQAGAIQLRLLLLVNM